MPEYDVLIENHGSLVLFYPLTDAAHEWFEENVRVPDFMQTAHYVACEPRFAPDIIAGLMDAGLSGRGRE